MSRPLNINSDPIWVAVTAILQVKQGFRVHFDSELSGKYSYFVPKTAKVTVESRTVSADDLDKYETLEGLIGRECKLTWDDSVSQNVIKAEFR